ncbi:MAG: TIR domain-containing protein, partial [Candidatus Aminicenantes bacterium]|nr:TIR domain-containing protein [Candidatus Aminicenantes bacterium]
MSFETDVFISYAHIDNLPLKEGEKGWVAKFHRALEVRLSQLLGEKPRIWRDQKLQGNDFFGEEIVDQFPKTAVMISIISPRYIKSEWCTREIDEFCKAAASKVGIKIGSKSRIFKIIKTAVPYDEHPGEIADTLGYEFYIVDPDSGRVKELNDKCPGDLEQMYWAKLDDIAHDICDLLDKIKNTGETGISLPREQLTVYLAETGFDVKEQRDIIKRELIASGYKIVPDCQLPPIEAEFNKTAAIFLEQSALSIHLIGGSYGMIPEDSRESIVIMQNKLAAQKSKTGNFLRLIWLLPGA